MAIRMYVIRVDGQDLSCPIIECDYCGKPIKDAKSGNYEWQAGDGRHGPEGLVLFTHKRCCHQLEDERSDGESLWANEGLEKLPLYLMHNLKMAYADVPKWPTLTLEDF